MQSLESLQGICRAALGEDVAEISGKLCIVLQLSDLI